MKTLLILFLSIKLGFSVAADMYATAAGAGNNSGDTWANAMTIAELETDWEGSAEAGDRYFLADGTYTLTQDIATALDGTLTDTIHIIGVKSGTSNEPPVFSDWSFTTDRPTLACAGFSLTFDRYWIIRNLDITTTDTNGLSLGNDGIIINCKSFNSSGAAGLRGFVLSGSGGKMLKCESISTAGEALRVNGNSQISFSYFHDSLDGIQSINTQVVILGCIIDTCTAGIKIDHQTRTSIINNTIYNCTEGIDASTANTSNILNNIFDANTVGADWDTEQFSNIFDYNIWDNGTDTSDVTKGNNAITGDPGMTNPAAGDFTLGSGSNAIDAGVQVGTNEGATGDYKWNIGADQDDVAAAGGGGGGSGFFMVD